MDIYGSIRYKPFKMNATLGKYCCRSEKIQLSTSGELDIVDITGQVSDLVAGAGVSNGVVHLFVAGATAALTAIEYEPGAVSDLRDALERIAPRDISYRHNERWGDGNGHSHVRAALLGPDITVPIREGAPLLGTWQQIIFVELDVKSRNRVVYATVSGTCASGGAEDEIPGF
jgi:secondary thiamine-phosphate synthase enzyme